MAAVRPIVIYSRKSKFTGKGESIENQIEMCRQYIRLQFGDDAAEQALVYEDEGFSGGTLERPQFKKMMADAKEKSFRAIVVYRLDRISRNIGDFAKLIEQLNKMKIDFISIKEQFDTSSPMGRAMMYISSVFSQLERETIAERIRDNMHELSKTGRWLGGNTPTGYESESVSHVTIDGKTKRACKLKILPEEIGIVKLIYDKFLETGSLTKTETYLLQNGYTTKNGKQFTRFAVKGILSNPVYLIADEFVMVSTASWPITAPYSSRVEPTRSSQWRNGSCRWASTRESLRGRRGLRFRRFWSVTNPKATASPAAMWPCSPAC